MAERFGKRSGRYWFAESNDCASPHFLSKLLPILENDRSLGLVYCQSYLVDPSSRVFGDAVQWTVDLDRFRWHSNFKNSGLAEVRDYLSKKNTIPNASAVLIRTRMLDRSINWSTVINYAGLASVDQDNAAIQYRVCCEEANYWWRSGFMRSPLAKAIVAEPNQQPRSTIAP